jgi:hypothetical protein
MPSFDFAVTKRAVMTPCKHRLVKSAVKRNDRFFEMLLKAPQPSEQRCGLVYAPISDQISRILNSAPRGKLHLRFSLLFWVRILGKAEMLAPLKDMTRQSIPILAPKQTPAISSRGQSLNGTWSNHV